MLYGRIQSFRQNYWKLIRTQSTAELNRKLTKNIPRRRSMQAYFGTQFRLSLRAAMHLRMPRATPFVHFWPLRRALNIIKKNEDSRTTAYNHNVLQRIVVFPPEFFLAVVFLDQVQRPSLKYTKGVARRMRRCIAVQRLSRKCVQIRSLWGVTLPM